MTCWLANVSCCWESYQTVNEPPHHLQVFYHNFVNELVRNLILNVNEVFPQDLPGPAYDKYAAVADDVDHLGYMDEV